MASLDMSELREEELHLVREFYNVQSTEEILDRVEEYLNQSESDSLEILVAGKMGVGKSSLINSIFGHEFANEGDSAAAVTTVLQRHVGEVKLQGKTSTITFWDSPGFGDVFNENEENTTQKLVQKVEEANIFLYCFDVRARLQRDDINGMIKITEKLGSDIWNKAIFTLNFSNDCKPPPGRYEDPQTYFTSMFNSWHSQITNALRDQVKVPDVVANNISVYPTGYGGVQPPGCADWFSSLFTRMCERVTNAGNVLLKLASKRVSGIPGVSELESDQPKTTCEGMKINFFCGLTSLPAPNSASVPQSPKEQSIVSPSAIRPSPKEQSTVSSSASAIRPSPKEQSIVSAAGEEKEFTLSVKAVVGVGAVVVVPSTAIGAVVGALAAYANTTTVVTAGAIAAGTGGGAAIGLGVGAGICLIGLLAYGVYKYYKRREQQMIKDS